MESIDGASTLFLARPALESGESVDVSDTPTGPWVEPMIRAKATNPRNGLPSWTRLGELAGLSTTTVTAMISGSRKTSTKTIRKIADFLGEDTQTVSEWLELTRLVREKYDAPPEADLLTERQRKALTNLIRAIVADDKEEGQADGNSPDKKSSEAVGDGFTPTGQPAGSEPQPLGDLQD